MQLNSGASSSIVAADWSWSFGEAFAIIDARGFAELELETRTSVESVEGLAPGLAGATQVEGFDTVEDPDSGELVEIDRTQFLLVLEPVTRSEPEGPGNTAP